MCNVNSIQETYKRLQDDESKVIYIDRLNYSITQDSFYLKEMVGRVIKSKTIWQDLLKRLIELSKNHELAIFGAGMWGNILYRETCKLIKWRYMIDSKPAKKAVDSIPVFSFQHFTEKYQGEYIVLSSFKNLREMKGQLQDHGISDESIIDAGSVIHQLTEGAIYFDLEELQPVREKEVFVDAGCFDAATTKRFFTWCGGKGYAYCMEPDERNIALIRKNLGDNRNVEMVEKAVWSKTTVLSINARGNCATSVAGPDRYDGWQRIEAVALDDILSDTGVTFIKMDIEGAEGTRYHSKLSKVCVQEVLWRKVERKSFNLDLRVIAWPMEAK